MKKLFIGLCILGMCSFAFAGMQKDNVEARLVRIIENIKSVSLSTAIRLGNLNQDGKDIVAAWGNKIDNDDKQKLQGLNTKITDAKGSLDALNLYIETEWDSIK